MTTASSFPQFPNLPTELRLSIWEEAIASPSIHVFDVCFPSRRGNSRSRQAFQGSRCGTNSSRNVSWNKYEYIAFLDSSDNNEDDEKARFDKPHSSRLVHGDPSMYKQRQAQRLTCLEAALASSLRTRDPNIVYLPGRGTKFEYDNNNDVLFLRFSNEDFGINTEKRTTSRANPFVSSIAEALEAHWSAEMALTIWQARRIAINVKDALIPSHVIEISYLASCIQKDLNVFYLVEHQGKRPTESQGEHFKASDLQHRGKLYRQLNSRMTKESLARKPDIIYGVCKTYREVFDFEKLSWDESHPTYVFARLISESVYSQQLDTGAPDFKGVRILLEEDDKP
ncbi:uncharacterized protein CTRU02_207134 [Colletotrichum truncatum]|uniref:Uncharacterized protein n=1 Tax=Colletotrichum truncatum TaxID=5467 RepID=A0ACC3YZY8_COLTU|nr:uncharacterized protein CTRU02_01238 [Colletotrichum truncatum]KAF6800833.1 hypothetical protein CTRU02_01238 [Colletotrichum truncatum]